MGNIQETTAKAIGSGNKGRFNEVVRLKVRGLTARAQRTVSSWPLALRL